jgi:FkbH-like protein
MKWLAPVESFKERLAAANKVEAPGPRLQALAGLANAQLSFLETIQLDAALRRAPAAADAGFEDVRLAILTASTVDHLLPPTRVAGLRRNLRIEGYAGGYGQYRQDLLNPTSGLHAFKPNVVLFSLIAKDFIGAVSLSASADEAGRVVAATVADIRDLWRRAREAFGGLVIQQSFMDVEPQLFGGLDASVPGASSRLVAQLNTALAEAAYADSVLWLDVTRAAARDGLDTWFDVARWLQAKMEIAPQAAPVYGDMVARLIAAARGKSRKCLVLDLDNTLWGGVIGDDGVEGIALGQGSAAGEAHLALQRYAKALKERGVILAVCSKNDIKIAEAAFRDHPEMLLKRGDIAVFLANWDDKVTNIRSIAQQLNIGLDSLVFVDDNPMERGHVRSELPMVAVPEMPKDPAHYVRVLADAGYFEATSFTKEDSERADQYAANAEREGLLNGAGGLDAYLEQLGMTVEFGGVTPLNLARVTQLINKTNQFNTTTVRMTEQDVQALAMDPKSVVLQFRLVDKFGDNGLVSVLLAGAGEPGQLDIANWVMSCRVFGRQLEDEAMNILVEAARVRGVRTLNAAYLPTAKNGVVRDLFERLGFTRTATARDAPEGASQWSLSIAEYGARPTRIARKEPAHV